MCLETLLGYRVDLDHYAIDLDSDPSHAAALGKMRGGLLSSLSRASCVLAYRSSAMLTTACFLRARHTGQLD